MLLFVADSTQCDQVFLHITAELTAMLLMMDVQVGTSVAMLAAPTIAPQHLVPQLIVLGGGNRSLLGFGKRIFLQTSNRGEKFPALRGG